MKLFPFLLIIGIFGGAQPVSAGVSGLAVTADRCAIAWALTGEALTGCQVPKPEASTILRSLPAAEDGYFVNFEFDSNALSSAAQAHLEQLSELLAGPLQKLCVKLIGHTDTVGSASYNDTLARRRADAVRLYLAGPGAIASPRIASEGAGERFPLPGLPGDHAKNRRVEILAKPGTADCVNSR